MGLLNLEEQLMFYGKYHSNRINVLTHIVCVPLIVWSSLVWAANTGPLLSDEPDALWRHTPFVPNLGFFLAIFYITYYILMEPVAGILYSPILLFLTYSATEFYTTNPDANWLAAIVHVVSWIAQFASHGFAERRSPALIENITQALLLAPLFVWLEVLFFLGYRPSLHNRVSEKVQAAIAELDKPRKKVQ